MPNEGSHMDAAVRLEHSVLAVEEEHELHAMVELAVPALPEDATRPPLRVALVVDRSGSMDGPKLAAAKRCAQWLADRLRPTDELALVDVRRPSPAVDAAAGRGRASPPRGDRIDRPGRVTNLSGGWLRGLGELVDAAADGPRKILLLTDGLANAGITDPDDLTQMARRARLEGVHDVHDRVRRGLRRGPAPRHGRRGRRQHLLRRDARRRAGHLRAGDRGARHASPPTMSRSRSGRVRRSSCWEC